MARTKSKSLPKIISPMVKVLKSTDEATTYLALGVPYFGPDFLEGKDLQGEYFDMKTDYGMMPGTRVPVISRGLSYYDHAYHPLFGTEPIGMSKFLSEVEDEGQWWEIEVRRAYRYHDFLLQLAEKGILGASSQPIQTSVEIDYDTGHIKRWHTAEVSLTPTPANPLATVELAKSIFSEEELPEVQKTLAQRSVIFVPSLKATFPTLESLKAADGDEDETPEEQAEEVEEAPVQIATEEHGEPSLADEIEAAFNDEDEEEDVETVEAPVVDEAEDEEANDEDEDVKEFDFKSILDAISSLRDDFNAFVTESADRDREVVKQVTEVRSGLSAFATNVAKKLKIEVEKTAEQEANKSTFERQADEVIRRDNHSVKGNSPYGLRSADVPDNAPGR